MYPTKRRFPLGFKIVIIVILVIVAVVVLTIVTAGGAIKAAEKVSNEFVGDVQAGNATAAYALTSSSFKSVTSQSQLGDLIQQVSPALQGQEKVTGEALHSATGTPETAVLVYTVNTAGGDRYMKVELQKNSGNWQVINFRSSAQQLNTTVE